MEKQAMERVDDLRKTLERRLRDTIPGSSEEQAIRDQLEALEAEAKEQPASIRVFICYAREDKEIAKKLYYDLKHSGIEPWIDMENLLPGQKWRKYTS
jgi:hypothetical protein